MALSVLLTWNASPLTTATLMSSRMFLTMSSISMLLRSST